MRKMVALLAVVPLILATACEGDGRMSRRGHGALRATPGTPPVLTITPGENAKNVPISAEIGTKVSGGTITDVILTEGTLTGRPTMLTGRLRDDGSSWVPDLPLKYRRIYTATVTATGADGTTRTGRTTFTTMGPPGRRVATRFFLSNGGTYGVALPLAVEFDPEIPPSERASVERRLFVTTSPPQPGVWAWSGGRQVLYRGARYWRPGTKISIRAALDGHPMGGDAYGDRDSRAVVTITNTPTYVDIDSAAGTMSVYRDGTLVRTMPVRLGTQGTASSSGRMVIMEKAEQTVFDTRADPDPANRYVANVEYAQRLTRSGTYIHAAPRSLGDRGPGDRGPGDRGPGDRGLDQGLSDQGLGDQIRRTVSPGCIAMSTPDAAWLFSVTKVGDPVTVRGTQTTRSPPPNPRR